METSRRVLLKQSALTLAALGSGAMIARAQDSPTKTGRRNLITDVTGLRIG